MPTNINFNSTNQSSKSFGSSAGGNQSLNVNDFLNLISAQLKNQDMMNPMNDTEFISQLAQFTSLQITQTMAENQSISLALNFVGKEVTAVNIGSDGKMEKFTGTVDKVSLYDGTPMVYIKDKKFSLFQIMEIGTIGSSNSGDGENNQNGENNGTNE